MEFKGAFSFGEAERRKGGRSMKLGLLAKTCSCRRGEPVLTETD